MHATIDLHPGDHVRVIRDLLNGGTFRDATGRITSVTQDGGVTVQIDGLISRWVFLKADLELLAPADAA